MEAFESVLWQQRATVANCHYSETPLISVHIFTTVIATEVLAVSIFRAMMMEAVNSSETSVDIYTA
jgi:hypothetical protein